MPTVSDAEIAELHAIIGDLSKQYGSLSGDVLDRLKKLESGHKSITSMAAIGYQPMRETLMLAKDFHNRPLPAQRGMLYRMPVAVKDILNVSRTIPQFVGITPLPQHDLWVRDLIPQSETTQGAVSGLNETSFTNAAAPVAEGAAKPKSDKTLTGYMVPIEVIAHYLKVSRQSYEDTSQLAAVIESNLLYGLALVLESQILKGDGVAPNLGPGLYIQATAAAAPPVTTPPATIIDQLFLAAAELAKVGYRATGAVLSSDDYYAMQMLKDTTGRYIGGGLPLPRIVVSPALATGEWLVGDFDRGSHLYVRADASIQIAAQNEDDFVKNKLTCLAELRAAIVSVGAAFRKNPAGGATVAGAPTERPRK